MMTDEMPGAALRCWREGFLPRLSDTALEALLLALRSDRPELIQMRTTQAEAWYDEPVTELERDRPPAAACAVGYAAWQGDGLETVGEVEEFFARACYEADQRLGEPAGCRHFLNWFDDAPRPEMLRVLAAEVERNLADRRK